MTFVAPRHRPIRRAATAALLGLGLLTPGLARAVDPIDETDDAPTATTTIGGTVATTHAIAPGLATKPPVATMASARVFRPAPLPNQRVSQPGETLASDDGEASLHPDFFRTGEERGSSALSTTSSEYNHGERLKPAGGMSLSIPMD